LLRRTSGVEQITGAREILPGIHAIASPGHTPHHLAFYAESAGDGLVFAGDSVKNVYELATQRVDFTMDPAQSERTIDRLRSLLTDTSAALVPGHDVSLALIDGEVRRLHHQQASIGFFADGVHGEQD